MLRRLVRRGLSPLAVLVPTRSQPSRRSWETAFIGATPPSDSPRRAPGRDDAAPERSASDSRPDTEAHDGEPEGLLGTNVTAEIATLPRLARTTEISGLPNPVPTALSSAADALLEAAGLPGGPR